eukprot:EC795058.1.p1 GENE.EC795058.1~~EC795058.1.p1  ORF type:complete len:196 (+),score=65.10 EC795058.1:46-588(+)
MEHHHCSHMDASSSSSSSSMMMEHMRVGEMKMTSMTFDYSADVEILWDSWHTRDAGQLVASMLALMLMAFVQQLFAVKIVPYLRKVCQDSMRSGHNKKDLTTPLLSRSSDGGLSVPASASAPPAWLRSLNPWVVWLLEIGAYTVQMTCLYLLMLAVMSMNFWLLVGVSAGVGISMLALPK